jgi:putative NADH-flavin reductase
MSLPTTTAPKSTTPLRVTVLGPTGLGGSAIAVELLNRGHHVTGMSRNPEKLGKHENYKTKKVDLSTVGMDELTRLLKDTDVVIE